MIIRKVVLTWLVLMGSFLLDFGTEFKYILQARCGGGGGERGPVTHHSRDLGIEVGASCVVK